MKKTAYDQSEFSYFLNNDDGLDNEGEDFDALIFDTGPGYIDVSGRFDDSLNQVIFDAEVQMQKYKQWYLDLGYLGNAIGLDTDLYVNLEAEIAIYLDLSFGVDLSETVSNPDYILTADDMFFELDQFLVELEVLSTDLDFEIDLNILQLFVDDAFINFYALADLHLTDLYGESNRLSLPDISAGNFLLDMDLEGSMDAILPIGITSDVLDAEARFDISIPTLFDNPTPEITAEGYITFADLALGDVLEVQQPTFTFQDNGRVLGISTSGASVDLDGIFPSLPLMPHNPLMILSASVPHVTR